MGYPTVALFDKEFIERTKEIVQTYTQQNREFTLLINCLLGLLVLPNEYIIKNKLKETERFKQKIEFFPKNIKKIFADSITICQDNNEIQMKKCIFCTNKGYEKSSLQIPFSELLGKLRNSIAHLNIQSTRASKTNGMVLFLRI